MNLPAFPSLPALRGPSARERAAIQADRARTELRHGRPVALVDNGESRKGLGPLSMFRGLSQSRSE